MSDLVKYDAACRAVAEARNVDEAKEFRDKSEAMRAYARQAKNKDLEVHAAEIRIRAERRIGQLMEAQRDAGLMNQGHKFTGGVNHTPPAPPTLEEAGIDKNLAKTARKLAAVPDDEFEGIVGDWKGRIEEENARVTVNLMAAAEREKPTDPYGFKKLSPDGLLDEATGLRQECEELRAKLQERDEEIASLKGKIAALSETNQGAVISKLQRQIDSMKLKRGDAMASEKRMEYRLKKAEQERDAARRSLENQEIIL